MTTTTTATVITHAIITAFVGSSKFAEPRNSPAPAGLFCVFRVSGWDLLSRD
jgi:hypothetical protein